MIPDPIKKAVKLSYQKLGQELAGFMPRKEQNFLVAEIVKTLCGEYASNKRILVAEAGTGIGKSLAYAQAAIPCAKQLNKKLVISTATLSLQEQLIHKDLPFFRSFSATEFSFTLVKGRQRYCCVQRLADLTAQEQQLSFSELLTVRPSPEQSALYRELWQAYNEGRWSGDRDSWPTQLDEAFWQSIAAERHHCNPILGHHAQCPFHQARSRLDEMDVLVVNHALLLADLALGGGVVLPPPEECFYILDEAHHLPTIARDQGAALCNLQVSQAWLAKMPHLGESAAKIVQNGHLARAVEEISHQVYACQHDIKQLVSLINNQSAWFKEDPHHRFPMEPLASPLAELVTSLAEQTRKLARNLERCQQALTESIKEGKGRQPAEEQLLAELGYALNRVTQMQELWHLYRSTGNTPPIAKWIVKEEAGQELTLHAAPLEMGGWLQQQLWSRCQGAIILSATLTALNRFDHFRAQAGLGSEDGTRYLRLKSPFDYQQAELLIPTISCEPSDPGYTLALIERLPDFLDGQLATLILFASYWQMQEVASGLRALGHTLLVQGEASREALLTLHKSRCEFGTPSILLGTGSFSEGLDLPGNQLTNLIITKLPFAVPTSPIEAALAEWVERKGGNPFLQITLPDASRKLIQACGRLIRKEGDSGRIVLLDRRLVTRHYGKGLLDALPPFRRSIHY